MSNSATWITRPVFVTSTFRDMQAERDWLREHVFPELKERLRERHCHLEAIDLRWGVETVAEGETEARELLVLKVCLAEIERSRPFLIALLGDRYGWVPPEGRMKRAVEEAGFETTVEGKSVTALEIEYGVLDSADQRRRSRFYFREPLPYGEMDEKTAGEFREEDSEAAKSLVALKARIEREMPARVRHYTARWDAEKGRVTGLEEFGRMVLEDLWADLAEEIAPLDERAEATRENEDRAAFEEFVEECERDFRGRAAITDELVEFALGAGEAWGMSLTGGPGSGKSALMAHVYRKLQDKALVLANAAGISLRSGSVDMLLRRWIGELAKYLDQPDHLSENTSPDELEQAFSRLLYQAAETTRVVVLLDALNQFEPTTRAAHVTWLPKMWPENARLIATAIPGTQSEALEGRVGVQARDLPPLSRLEAEEIAAAICGRYHRTLNPDVLVVLTAKEADGEAACGNPLWLELALEELNLLDEDDFRRADRQFSGRPDERLHQLLLHVADEMPADIEGMYGWLLTKTEEVWGEAWARGFANLIALSRGGWREIDMERLLPMVSGEDWDPARFAGLRRSFRAHLVQRGLQGQWDFFHAQARQAVLTRNLPDAKEVRRLHSQIADHLEGLPRDDSLRQTELMYHLIGADDRSRAAHLYSTRDLSQAELVAATQALAAHLVAFENQSPNLALPWIVSLLDQPDLSRHDWVVVGERYLFGLNDRLMNEVPLTTRLDLLRALHERVEVRLGREEEPGALRVLLSNSHAMLGDALRALGDLDGAIQHCQAALDLYEQALLFEGRGLVSAHSVVALLSKIGDVLAEKSDPAAALDRYRKALDLEEALASDTPSPERPTGSLATTIQGRIGDALAALGSGEEALRTEEAALVLDLDRAASGLDVRDALLTRHTSIGDLHMRTRDWARAREAFCQALSLAEGMVQEAPDNRSAQALLAQLHERLGTALQALGDLPGALRECRAALDVAERLAAQDPNNALWWRTMYVGHGHLGDIFLLQCDPARAQAEYEAALFGSEQASRRLPQSVEPLRHQAVSHSQLAKALIARSAATSSFRLISRYRCSRAATEHLLQCRDLLRALEERGPLDEQMLAVADYVRRWPLLR